MSSITLNSSFSYFANKKRGVIRFRFLAVDLDLEAILSLSSSFDILLTDLFVKNLPTPILDEDKKLV